MSDAKRRKTEPKKLLSFMNEDAVEACVDEVGRGVLFGPVYVAAVVLPKTFSPPPEIVLRDSKKMTEAQRFAAEAYIKEHALDWSVCYMDSAAVDKYNVSQAVVMSWHAALSSLSVRFDSVLVDGVYFRPYEKNGVRIPHACVKKGDDTYYGIACASILAKNARDRAVVRMIERYPVLNERYDLCNNVGYPAPKHLAGIKKWGISEFHRKTFGPCKGARANPVGGAGEESEKIVP
jgi:ribonuclease HII